MCSSDLNRYCLACIHYQDIHHLIQDPHLAFMVDKPPKQKIITQQGGYGQPVIQKQIWQQNRQGFIPPHPKILTKSGRLLFAPSSVYIQINRIISTPQAKKDTASIAVKNRAAAISPTFILYFLSVLLTFLTDKLPFPV